MASTEPTMKDVFDVVSGLMETTAEGFDKFDKRFGGLETRMDGLDTRMGSLDTRMDSLENRMSGIERRLGKLEDVVESLQNQQIAMSADIKDILMSLDKIEKQLENNKNKNQELETKLLKLHEWCIEAGEKIGITYPQH